MLSDRSFECVWKISNGAKLQSQENMITIFIVELNHDPMMRRLTIIEFDSEFLRSTQCRQDCKTFLQTFAINEQFFVKLMKKNFNPSLSSMREVGETSK